MISFGLDARSTIKEYRNAVDSYDRDHKEDPAAYEFEMSPQIQYALAKAYILGYNEGAGQMTGEYMMDKFEMSNMINDLKNLQKKEESESENNKEVNKGMQEIIQNA